MGSLGGSDNPPDRQERKYPRFKLRYPVHGTFYSADRTADFDAVSRNVSIGGLLLETGFEIPADSLVSFTMTLHGGKVIRPIRLTGEGQVVRVEPSGLGAGFAVAVSCTYPIAHMEDYLSSDQH